MFPRRMKEKDGIHENPPASQKDGEEEIIPNPSRIQPPVFPAPSVYDENHSSKNIEPCCSATSNHTPDMKVDLWSEMYNFV